MKNRPRFMIGCSGYYYSDWKNTFYPEKLMPADWLMYYSSIFNSVELNGTFYRLPTLASLKKQYEQVPDNFGFSVKVSRYITHISRLRSCREKVKEFSDLILSGLREKLVKLLFQLPPSFKYSEENLESIYESIPAHSLNVIEFRNSSWWEVEPNRYLKDHNYTFCNTDYPGLHQTYLKTNETFYARMHGVPELFASPYSEDDLKNFVAKLPEAETYCIYFNNTMHGNAYKNAVRLGELLNLM